MTDRGPGHGERPARRSPDAPGARERGLHWAELTVTDVMTELSTLDAIPLEAMRTASVGDVVATLTRFGRDHLLVSEARKDDAHGRVRGVISRTQVERQLGRAIEVTPIATTFAEIERALA